MYVRRTCSPPNTLPPLYSSTFPDYDLVRIYHPDSPAARAGGIPPETAHARFQAISSAYAVLSGKKPATSLDGAESEGFGTATRSSYHDLSTAMWRAKQRRRAEMDIGMDDRWKERLMLGAILLVRLHLVLLSLEPCLAPRRCQHLQAPYYRSYGSAYEHGERGAQTTFIFVSNCTFLHNTFTH